ncbi:MAG: LLM class flavin-dependent oxidoreductase [Chloroflexi bacterium]|nr:LLM class flavin-dependent oxidoreductase [Chloroflexota bacterium]
MSKSVQLGCLLPTRGLLLADSKPTDAESVLRLATWAEEAGMDSVWVGDSLTAKPRLEAMTTLAAIAARTSRVRLGTAVMLMALRQPVLLAQMMGTVDLISGGRLQLGVGVGGAFNGMQQAEWRNAEVPQRTRARRLEEMLQVVKGLGSGKPFSYDGRHFQLDDVVMEPTPVQSHGVPVYLGVHWHGRGDGQGAQRERQARRAARLADGAISISATPDELIELNDTVRGYCAEYDRDPDAMSTVMYLTVNLDEDIARAEAEAEDWLLGYYGANIWGDRWGPFGSAERVREKIHAYVEAGADQVIVRFATYRQEEQMQTFLEQVAPDFTS